MAICAVVALVAGGLCGVQLLVLNNQRGWGDLLGPTFMVTGALELIAILVCAVVGFVALLVWGFGSMFRRDGDS
ncbi:MAG TPA: hypothetical protein VGL22_06355 [Terracidiphilus sp.]|jgi:hypothetical protein